MTRLEAALVEMVELLDEMHIPYMLIGGLAVAQWGEPRATLDVDLTLWVEPSQFEFTLERLAARLTMRTPEPLEFARRTRVLPALAANGVTVDLVFAAWPLEQQAIEQAVVRNVAGAKVRVAGINYLLLLKLISERPKDQADAFALFRRHRDRVNLVWLEQELGALADALAQPSMLERLRSIVDEE